MDISLAQFLDVSSKMRSEFVRLLQKKGETEYKHERVRQSSTGKGKAKLYCNECKCV